MDRVIPNFKLTLFLLALSILIILADLIHFLSLPKYILSYITTPISFGLYQTYNKISRQFYFIFNLRSAAVENKALKEQLGQLLSENAQIRKRLAETESLVAQQNALGIATYNLTSARPIGIQRYLRIDKGSKSGLKQGNAVVFKDNYLGKIVGLSENLANVQLLSDPDSKVAAFSQGLEGKAKGVLTGKFGSEMVLEKILHEEKIKIGDLVYSEGTEGFLPRGLILGKVSQVLGLENEVFKQAKVQPNFDIRDLDLVFVIKE